MSWWKKALKYVGYGAEGYADFRLAKDPNSRTAKAIKTGGQIVVAETSEEKPKPGYPAPEETEED